MPTVVTAVLMTSGDARAGAPCYYGHRERGGSAKPHRAAVPQAAASDRVDVWRVSLTNKNVSRSTAIAG